MNTQKAPKPYQPPGQDSAAKSFYDSNQILQGAGTDLAKSVTPQYQQIVSNIKANPYALQAQQGANTTAAQARDVVAPSQFAGAAGLDRLGTKLSGLIDPTILAGFDPGGTAYGRALHQNQEQVNAVNAQYGVAGSPYGAGVASDANINFNNTWQQNEQGRQIAALGGLGQLGTSMGSAYSGASDLNTAGLNTQYGASQLPYGVYGGQQNDQIAALNALVGGTTAAYAPLQTSIGNYGQYLGIGQQANQGAINAAQVNNQASNAMWSGLGQLTGTLGSAAIMA